MITIKSVKDLPQWFKDAKYEKNLGAVDWYREIRKRQLVLDTIEKVRSQPNSSLRSIGEILEILHTVPKDWPLYELPQHNWPVEDMTKIEAIYIAACFDDEKAKEVYARYQELMRVFRSEVNNPDQVYFSRKYEEMLRAFYETYASDGTLGELAYLTVADTTISKMHLSYGRPLHGYPVIIDTQYDDETILQHVRQWLAEHRAEKGEKPAKRPFSQNDFDDWTYYKIREVVDLEMWATVNGVRIQDKVIAAALWPHTIDEISPIDMLRTTSRKKVKEIFQWDVCVRLYGQLRLERGENFLSK